MTREWLQFAFWVRFMPVYLHSPLMSSLTFCRWGQVFILNSLATYTPRDSNEALGIAERVTPRLQHANSAVVLGAVKVLMRLMDHIQAHDAIRDLSKKMAPPLGNLLKLHLLSWRRIFQWPYFQRNLKYNMLPFATSIW